MIGATIAAAVLMAGSTVYNGMKQEKSAKKQLAQQQAFQEQNLAESRKQAAEQEMQYNAANQQSPDVEDFDTGGNSGYGNILSGTNQGYTIQTNKLGSVLSGNNSYSKYNQSGSI